MRFLRAALALLRPTVPVPELHGDHHNFGPGSDETTHLSRLPELDVDEDGWLIGEDVEHVPTARTQALVNGEPLGVVWHWTATRGQGRRLAERIARSPRPGERSASWGTLIPAAGPLIQSASLLRGTWHAGGESAAAFTPRHSSQRTINMSAAEYQRQSNAALMYPYWTMSDHAMMNKVRGEVSANSLFHGVELENAGEVRVVEKIWDVKKKRWLACPDEYRAWPFGGQPANERGPGFAVPPGEVVTIKERHYHRFTEHQVAQAERLVRLMRELYDLPEHAFRLTHKKIDPTRKGDPEPSWLVHLDDILSRVF